MNMDMKTGTCIYMSAGMEIKGKEETDNEAGKYQYL